MDKSKSGDYKPIETSDKNIVIDNGTHSIKAGFSGDDAPIKVFPNVLAEKMVNDGSKYGQRKLIKGTEALSKRDQDGIKMIYPMEEGRVVNWDDIEKIWHHTFYNELKIAPEEHRILFTERALNPKANRERMCQIMMETFNVPAYYVSVSAVLTIYGSGRTSGLAIDFGYQQTDIIPVYEGYHLPHAIRTYKIGGRDITQYLQQLLMKRDDGKYKHYVKDLEIVREIKEKYGYVAGKGVEEEMNKPVCNRPKWLAAGYLRSIDKDFGKYTAIEIEEKCDEFVGDKTEFLRQNVEYKLPDGKVIEVGDEMFKCSEIMFNPLLMGDKGYNGEYDGLGTIAGLVTTKVDVDIRREMFFNVIISGGNSCWNGIKKRLSYDIDKWDGASFKSNVIGADKLKYGIWSAWIGGSILSSLSTFEGMWLTREEYSSAGPSIVHRKCF